MPPAGRRRAAGCVSLTPLVAGSWTQVYLVADNVAVHSKSNDDEKQWVWESTADSTFSVYEDQVSLTLTLTPNPNPEPEP